MSLASEALQPLIMPELAGLSGRSTLTAVADIILAEAAAFDLEFDDGTRSIGLDFREPTILMGAWAGECCRFSSASFQTISVVESEIMDRDRVAWSLVKVYYAAFYAGHALLRLFGESCSFLDKRHVDRLTELADAMGTAHAFTMESGLYHCELVQKGTALGCTKTRGGSGTHEAFWKVFGNQMGRLSERVLSGILTEKESQLVFVQLILNRRSGYSWLSGIRNELQYRQQHKVWFPFRLRQADKRYLSHVIGHWQRDPMAVDLGMSRCGLIGEFVSSCIFIVALCHAVLARIAERSPVGARSFVSVGPLSFLNDIGAKRVA